MRTNLAAAIGKRRFWAAILAAQIFLFYILSQWSWPVALTERFFEYKKFLHQFLLSKVPFSIGDVIYVFLVLFLFYGLFRLFSRKKRKASLCKLLVLLNVSYFIYQIFWGMLYFQPPLLHELPKEEISVQEAKVLSLKLLKQCIEERATLSENDKGVFQITDLRKIENQILATQRTLPAPFNTKKVTDINAFKPSLFGNLMSYTGILGYYNPFTSEALYNSALPSSYLPFTLAHESGHQLGYAREQEANFVGYLIGKSSASAEVRYSSTLFGLKSLLHYIEDINPKFVKSTVSSYSAAMSRDRNAEQLFFQQHQGFLTRIFSFTNNLFLKSNQQDGVISYSYFTELLIKYERKGQ